MTTVLAQINRDIEQKIFPGCAFALVRGDEVIEEHWLGSAAVEAEVLPFTGREMRWDLASVSKVVGVGTVCINLILGGQLKLDQPLATLYPAWHEDTVTLKQLLTHTSGIDPFIADRNQMGLDELVAAMNQLKVTTDKAFHYTDVNFILLGFMLETLYQQSLDQIFEKELFQPWEMSQTSFGPVANAVPTSLDVPIGTVHDPKAQVLGVHAGSAGLFSTLPDLINFVKAYFSNEKYLKLLTNYAEPAKARSLAWDLLEDNWLLHTGYTGPFILLNLQAQKAVIFLTNRVHFRDDRAGWIQDRNRLIDLFLQEF